jgi:ABC-type multidrug transport system ATPase subunit
MSLEIHSLNKKFDKKIIFQDFSFKFKKSGLYILTGESGKGKTTLLRIIAGLDNSYTGEVLGNESISYMFQEYRLFPNLSAQDNVLLCSFDDFSNSDKKNTTELLARLGLTDADLTLFPDELSGGMKQRVAFARAILHKSEILLLDEPTKELDSELKERFLEIIKKEAENRLVIFVTHDTDIINSDEFRKIII